MRISTALCTYNGAAFLEDQLDSIAVQTRLPDELIVCDDRSSDDTASIVQRFAASATFPVRFEVNPRNLGSTANFAKAIGLCTGDVILLSDQDDVWLPRKVERIERMFLDHPRTALVFTDAEVVDVGLKPLGYTLWESIRFRSRERERFRNGAAFECLMKRYRVTGATAGFRANLRDYLLPIPEGWVHDAWIAVLCAAVAEVVPLDECLIRYRQHPKQQIGGKKWNLLAQYRVAAAMSEKTFRANAANFAKVFERLLTRTDVDVKNLDLLSAKLEHLRRRIVMRQRAWRFPFTIKEFLRGDYFRFSQGWKAFAQDLFLD